jgi:RND family efflux transporter MFP subunit
LRGQIRTAALSGLIATLVAVGCHKPELPPASAPVPVTVRSLAFSTEPERAAYSANFRPYAQVDVTFKVSGYVDSIPQVTGADGRPRAIQSGDPIKLGDLLATIRTESYARRVGQASAELEGAQAELLNARRDYERNQQLMKQNVIARASFDASQERFQRSQANVRAAQAAMQEVEVDLTDCKLKSPMEGTIVERNIEVGTLVSPSMRAFQIADVRSMKAVFGVPDFLVGKLKPGKALSVTTEAVPGVKFQGVITRISPAADAHSRMFDVEVTIQNPKNRLRIGTIASLHLDREVEQTPVMIVPLNSLVRSPDDPNGYAVFVAEDRGGRMVATLRNIRVGDIAGNGVAVSDGLKPGDRVIVRGSGLIVDGKEVAVAP